MGTWRWEIGRHTSELQSHSDLVCRLLLPPSPTLFPYTTLFRSIAVRDPEARQRPCPSPGSDRRPVELQTGDDEENTRVRRAGSRSPKEGEQQRNADRPGDGNLAMGDRKAHV